MKRRHSQSIVRQQIKRKPKYIYREPNVKIPEGDILNGSVLYDEYCASCHEPGGVGPSLLGIIGRRAGVVCNFDYSEELQNTGIVWTKKHLFEFIYHPASYIPGNKMVFGGLRSPKERADLISYLESF